MSNVKKNPCEHSVSAVDWIEPLEPGGLYVCSYELFLYDCYEYARQASQGPWATPGRLFGRKLGIIPSKAPFVILNVIGVFAEVLYKEQVGYVRFIRGELSPFNIG